MGFSKIKVQGQSQDHVTTALIFLKQKISNQIIN